MMKKKLPIHGSGGQRRSYMHVDDVARAFDVILHKVKKTMYGLFIISVGNEITLHVCVARVMTLLLFSPNLFIKFLLPDELGSDWRSLQHCIAARVYCNGGCQHHLQAFRLGSQGVH